MINLTSGANILDRAALNAYIGKFNSKVTGITDNIDKLNKDIESAYIEKQTLLLQDITSDSDEFKVPLTNCIAKIANMKQALELATEQRQTFIDLMKNAQVEMLLNDFRNTSRAEILEYTTVEEKIIYDELALILSRQLELMDQLTAKRDQIENEINEFNQIAEGLGYAEYKFTIGFHDNPLRANDSCGEENPIMFNCTSIKNAQTQLDFSKRCY